MSHIRTTLPVPTQPWDSAKAKFLEGLSQEDVSRFEAANIENIFYSTEVAQRKHATESKIWPLQQRMSSLVDAIDDYGKALDVYVNTNGLILSPIWGSIRVVLHIASEVGKFQEKLVDMLARIGDVLPRFRIYERLYKDHERLLVALSHAYLDILRFCVRTKDFFLNAKRSMIPLSIVLKAAWKPFRQDFDVHMNAFRMHSKQIEQEARLAHRIESARMYEIQLANRALQIRNSKLQKRHDLLSVLPSIDYLGKHSRFQRNKHPGTNAWLKNTSQYTDWLSSQGSDCLCCYGIPGSGKSILASSVVEDLTSSLLDDSSIVCQYYCDYADSASLDPYCLAGSLLKQALQSISLDKFTDEFQCPFIEGKPAPSFEIMSNYLMETLQDFRTVYIVLDGIDEIAQENQQILLALINDMLRKHSNLKIFVTSRTEEYWIRKVMDTHRNVHLSEACTKSDITLFIQDHLDAASNSGPLSANEGLKEKVLAALVEGANGMFLWVKFQLLELREALTEHAVNEALQNLPRDLSETYSRIISRIQHGPGGATKIENVQKIFIWISGSKRPLQLAELEEAIGLEPTDKLLPADRIARHAGRRLVADCGNLVVCNDEDGTVRFAHHTVLQYLCDVHSDHHRFFPSTEFDDAAVNDYIGQICLAYLSFADFETQIAVLPTQLEMQRDAAEEILWWGVPFGSKLRKAITWVRPSSDMSHRPTPRQVPLILPAYVKASSSWTRKFVLLDYVIACWVYHTSMLKTESSHWSTFRRVALERNLLFDFRPWNEPSHHGKLEDILISLKNRHPASQPPAWQHGHDADMLMYSWAMAHGVPSIIKLLSSTSIRLYLNMTFADVTGVSHERYPSHGLLQFFDAMLVADSTATELPLGTWNGEMLYQIADMIQVDHMEPIFHWCSIEYHRWVNQDATLFDMFYKDALCIAVQHTNVRAFERLMAYHAHSHGRLADTLSFLVSSDLANTSAIKEALLMYSTHEKVSAQLESNLVFVLQQCLPTVHAILQAKPDALYEISLDTANYLVVAALSSDHREHLMTVLLALEHVFSTVSAHTKDTSLEALYSKTNDLLGGSTFATGKARKRLEMLLSKDLVEVFKALREELALAKILNQGDNEDLLWRRPFSRSRTHSRSCMCRLDIVGQLFLCRILLYSDADDFQALCLEIISSYQRFLHCSGHTDAASRDTLNLKYLRWGLNTPKQVWRQVLAAQIPEDAILRLYISRSTTKYREDEDRLGQLWARINRPLN